MNTHLPLCADFLDKLSRDPDIDELEPGLAAPGEPVRDQLVGNPVSNPRMRPLTQGTACHVEGVRGINNRIAVGWA